MPSFLKQILLLSCFMTANSTHAQDLISFQYCKSVLDTNNLIPKCNQWINEQTFIQLDTNGHTIKIESVKYLNGLTGILLIDSVTIKSRFQDSEGNWWIDYNGNIKRTKCLVRMIYPKSPINNENGILQLQMKNSCWTYKFKYKQGLIIQAVNLRENYGKL